MGNGDCRLRSPFEFLPFRGSDYGGDGRRRAGGRRRGSSQAEASGTAPRRWRPAVRPHVSRTMGRMSRQSRLETVAKHGYFTSII